MRRAAINTINDPRVHFACLLSLVTLSIAGCGEGNSGPATVNVSGTIYLDGQPLSDAIVNFTSAEFSASGRTNADGRYTLAQGAVPGKNKVTVEKWKGGEFELDPEEGMDEGQFEAMAEANSNGRVKVDVGPKQLIPEHYSDLEKTDLTFDVPEDGTDAADFRLQGK